jgi:hypothetical protein
MRGGEGRSVVGRGYFCFTSWLWRRGKIVREEYVGQPYMILREARRQGISA